MLPVVAFVIEHIWYNALLNGHLMRLEVTRVGLLVACFFLGFA